MSTVDTKTVDTTAIDAKTLTFAELQAQVGEWSARNFPDSTPDNPFYGLVEETGELAHAILKSKQGIRGTKEEHEAAEKDAIGDITIFLMDLCERSGFDRDLTDATDEAFSDEYDTALRIETFDDLDCGTRLAINGTNVPTPNAAFRRLVEHVGEMADYGSAYGAGVIMVDLAAYCYRRGFSLADIVAETWEEVRKRDWTADKTNGQAG